METHTKRNSFKGSIGFVLAAAGSAVGLGNIWRFPYLAAKDGGGMFIVIYIILALTYGFTILITEVAIGRKTKQSPLTAYGKLNKKWKGLGVIACLVPIIILPYYCAIGGWVLKYFLVYLTGNGSSAAQDGYFKSFISGSYEPIIMLLLFLFATAFVEPLSNLDAKLRAQTRTEISKLHQRLGTTFIYVTHDQVEAMTLGDRIVIMKDGFIQQVGTPIEVFHFPRNIFVAGFIGTPQMNFFDAELIKDENGYSVKLLGMVIRLNDKMQEVYTKNNVKSMPVTLGVRAENLAIVPQGSQLSVDTIVEVSEMLGNEVHLHAYIDNKDTAIRIPALDADAESIFYQPGDKITVGFNNKALHIFDKEKKTNLYYND